MTSFVPDPTWPSIVQLGIEIWGQINKAQSKRDEVRFGTNGSKKVTPSKNLWCDYESGEGGGYAQLWDKARPGQELPTRTDGTGPKPKGNGRDRGVPPWQDIHTTYDYPGTDADARLIQVVRTKSGSPRFLQRQPISGGKWKWSVDGIPDHNRRLYRLAELRAAALDERIWICAGEKDTDRLHNVGLTATTNIGGEGKWRPEYAEEFRDRHCIALQDNDATGERHVADVARSLHGVAASVKVLLLPSLPPKGDVSDFLDAGHTVNELLRLADEAPAYTSPQSGRIVTGDAFISTFVPPDWQIDGIVQRGRLYACTSLTGHGKTAAWLFNACMVQAGRMISSLDVVQGNVLILAGENPEDLKARMHGMVGAYKLKPTQLPYVLPGNFPLTEDEADKLKQDIAALGVPFALILGDTASSFFPGDDENSNVQAGTYARTLRTFTECDGHPAVVVLSHPTKGATRGNLLPRGGGAFLNELDGNLSLWSHMPGEVTELHWCGKIRGPDFSPLGYRLRPVPIGFMDRRDREVMTIVAEPMSEEAVADHAKQTLANEDVVLRSLRDQPGRSYAQIAREAGWVSGDDQPERWRVQRRIDALAADKLIHQPRRGGKWQLTDKGKDALAGDE